MRLLRLTIIFPLLLCSCAAQKYNSFTTPIPLPHGHFLILGFQGGRDDWNDPRPGVARIAQKLRSMNLRGVHVEIVENQKRNLAISLIHNAFDFNKDQQLTNDELNDVRIILYGMSFGGAAVVKLAKQLNQESVPVLLTVQVDSVGRSDSEVPPNVKSAANLFQRNGLIIHGETEIKAVDPSRTKILGNFEYDYKNSPIDISNVSWIKKIFRVAHTKMDRDPEVWKRVEELILEEISSPKL